MMRDRGQTAQPEIQTLGIFATTGLPQMLTTKPQTAQWQQTHNSYGISVNTQGAGAAPWRSPQRAWNVGRQTPVKTCEGIPWMAWGSHKPDDAAFEVETQTQILPDVCSTPAVVGWASTCTSEVSGDNRFSPLSKKLTGHVMSRHRGSVSCLQVLVEEVLILKSVSVGQCGSKDCKWGVEGSSPKV